MKTLTDQQAQADLPRLMEQAAASHDLYRLMGTTASAVLASAEDWHSIKETLYLLYGRISAGGNR